ncbi:hypothetical protein Amsp01_016760 [Amycolatopsis sp. NBRC 101858]|uniref:hypothetical protein n=1 Tax=Amycolatopsis sp. NBRC 101858 TaxID=3032200 RepID=UPI0024A5253A|nr:hypothetical protein [Amycolatopsis sp. NBRC 101858]GLY35652.1 hypothetical protein Amsp01_016760 [Amycolatopsis sp. NBRC 101858]
MKIKITGWLIAVSVATFAAQAVPQLFVGDSASAVPPSLQRIAGPSTATNQDSPKNAVAYCPSGTRLVGGGGWASDQGSGKVMLTGVEPIRQGPNPPKLDYYDVWARKTDPAFSGAWSLQAYAICAAGKGLPANSGMYQHSTDDQPAAFKSLSYRCAAEQRIVSAGTTTVYTGEHVPVGVQLVRASGPLDITRSTAHTARGFGGNWKLTTTAICADPIPGVQVVSEVVNTATAAVTCPAGTSVYGAGVGGSLTDSGEAFVRGLYVSPDLRTVLGAFTVTPVGGMVVQAVCAPTP